MFFLIHMGKPKNRISVVLPGRQIFRIGKIEPHLKFCPLCLRHAVVVFNQRIYNGIFAERNMGVTRCCRNLFLNL